MHPLCRHLLYPSSYSILPGVFTAVPTETGGRKEIPRIRGKEQQLRLAGAAVKRDPTSKVRETEVTWQALREGIRGQTE